MHRRQWIALVVLGAIGVALLLAVAFVPWNDNTSATAVPTVYHAGDEVHVKQGDEFVLSLTATPSTGYSWREARNPDVVVVNSEQIEGGQEPGAAGTQELTFRAVRVGATTVHLAYARPFEHGTAPAKTQAVAVNVTK